MKALLLLFIASTLSGAASAGEWINFGDSVFYSQPQQKEYNGTKWFESYFLDNRVGTVRYTMRNNGRPTSVEDLAYASMVTKTLFYCDEQRMMEMGDRLFDKPMATGNVIRDSLGQQPALHRVEMLPGSVEEVLFSRICKQSQKR